MSLPPTLTSTSGTALTRHVYQFAAATGGPDRGFFVDTTVVGNTANRDQALGDPDNGGDLNLVTTGALFGCRIFLNDGPGRYTFKIGVVTGQTPSGLTLADVDNDDDLDMLVGDADNNSGAVCIKDGLANFIGSVTGAQNAPVSVRPMSVAAGDVDGDGDGDLDCAATQPSSGTNYADIRLNDGQITATAAAHATVSRATVYPNPAHSHFAVLVPAELRPAASNTPLRLYDAVGRLVLEQPWQLSASGELMVDAARLPRGIYLLRLVLKGGPVSYELVLQ